METGFYRKASDYDYEITRLKTKDYTHGNLFEWVTPFFFRFGNQQNWALIDLVFSMGLIVSAAATTEWQFFTWLVWEFVSGL